MVAFGPVTPAVTAAPGYRVTMTLNGRRYDGRTVTAQDLHQLEIEAVGPQGHRVTESIAFFIGPESGRAPRYVHALEKLLLRKVARSPYTRPTPSAEPNYVIGWTKGWPANPEVPPHEIFGFQITDPSVPDEQKVTVVLTDGNHPREQTGSWGHRAIVDFLLSDEPEAAIVRRLAVFNIYPMLNPDGRYLANTRGNPELEAEGLRDHNRVWNTVGRFTTIDILTEALRRDTGGKVDILLDFHSARTSFFFSSPHKMDASLARAITRRDPEILPRESGGQPGMMRIWSMSEEGLSSRLAYTPEIAGGTSATNAMRIGRNFGLAIHDLLTGQSLIGEMTDLGVDRPLQGYGEHARRQLAAARDRVAATVSAGQPRTLIDIAEDVVAEIRNFERVMAERNSTATLISAARTSVPPAGEGFGALFGGTLDRRIRALEAVLNDPAADSTALSTAAEELAVAVEACQSLAETNANVAVVPVVIPGSPASLSSTSRADWEQGFLLRVVANGDELGLASQAVLEFAGTGDHVETRFQPGVSTLGQQFTWEFWKRYGEFSNNSGSSGADGNTPRFYTQIGGANGEFRVAIGNRYWTATTLPATDTWYHIAVVYDQGEVRTYVDGVLVDTRANVSFEGNSPNRFAIGRGFRGSRWLVGASREHRIWNVARSEVDLRLNMNRELTGNEPGLVAYWKLNEGTGTRVRDHAGRNAGVIHGARWSAEPKPGYRISQPVRFAGVRSAASSSITWDASGRDADGSPAVQVDVGLSASADELPRRWHTATPGAAVPGLEPGTDLSTRYLWIRQRIVPAVGDDPAQLRNLSLTVN